MKFLMNLALLFITSTSLLLLTGCFSKNSEESKPTFRLIDVNEPEYFNDAHIAGAINLPAKDLENKYKAWNKNDNIVIYCTDYLCSESTRLAKKLVNNGFANVSVYKGGTHEWFQLSLKEPEKYKLIGNAEKKYLQRPVEKVIPNDIPVKVITAEELSKILAA